MGESMPLSGRSPARDIGDPDDRVGPQPGLALCLSGGGYRAALFHLGALWRLNEIGWLGKFDRISSVSGGSIPAAMLGARWSQLGFDQDGVGRNFEAEVVAPIRRLCEHDIGNRAFILGLLLPGSRADKLAAEYSKHLFGAATLQTLPDRPRFVINATNVQTGALFLFSKPSASDHRVGKVQHPDIPLATAVAASSAFPPLLSPLVLSFAPGQMQRQAGADLHREPFTTRVFLTDGGVYDNIGVETAWKRYRTVLVSDAGGELEPEPVPKRDMVRHAFRTFRVVDNQVISLRKRQIIDAFADPAEPHDGAYWGISSRIDSYGLPDVLPCPADRTLALAGIPTRLLRMEASLQPRLINWGYALTDAALRRHVAAHAVPPPAFPYPAAGV